ncbi:MAG TPA: nucleotidyltransferase family protein [Gemmatimonadaceae bacterium]|nr:nucleotidyltransferase family protein [Gemmatimonadaceae bacterium]
MVGLSAPLAAVVSLSRRLGADGFTFESSGAQAVSFLTVVFARAEQLSVLGLILVELARGGRLEELKSVSGFDIAVHLHSLRRQAAMWDLETDSVLRQLSQAGVSTVLLKGAALRFTAYRDSAERTFGDIDVLVPKDSLQEAVAALVDRGYEPDSGQKIKLYLEHFHHLILRKPSGFVAEVHWALEPVKSLPGLDSAAFLRDARWVVTPEGARARVPSPEHMVLHLAQQNLDDGFSQLRRLVDVDRVVSTASDFDWAQLASESKQMWMQGAVALTLRLAELLLGTDVPAGFIHGLGLSRAARTHLALLDPVALVLERRGQRRAVSELLLLWCMPDVPTRLRTLKEIGTGERDRPWLTIAPGSFASGTRTRVAAVAKLAAYQAFLYPAALFGTRASARQRDKFWGR